MTRRLDLEEFSAPPSSERAVDQPDEPGTDLEALRLEAYDKGYNSGWEDCTKAQVESRKAIAADLEQNLRDLSFTYLEARGDVFKSVVPLLSDMVEKLLPRIAADAMKALVSAELNDLLDAGIEMDFEIVAAPGDIAPIESIIDDMKIDTLRVVGEQAYSPGHVSLRLGSETREIDVDGAISRIASAMREFTEANADENDALTRKIGVA